jgi:hypothetical protein
MYEMEGPRPARAPSRADDSAADVAPGSHRVLGAAENCRSPGSAPRSLGSPGDRPAFGGERLSTATVAGRTRRSETNYKILLAVHRTCRAYPPHPAHHPQLVHRMVHRQAARVRRPASGVIGSERVRRRLLWRPAVGKIPTAANRRPPGSAAYAACG